MSYGPVPPGLDELILEFNAKPVQLDDAPGRGPQRLVSLRDVTERVSAEERFRAAFDQLAVGMALLSLDGRLQRVNERFCAITGHDAVELLGRKYQDLVHPDGLEESLRQKHRLLSGEASSYSIEQRYVARGGREVWGEVTMSIVRRSDGTPDHFIALLEDVTQRRNLEDQLIQAQKLDAIGQLAGGVAHDFNNILTVIQGHAALLGLEEMIGGPARESVEEISRAAQRATSLTRQLLLFSRREVMQLVRLDLNESVTQLTRMLRRLIGENVRMELRLHPEPLPVVADAGMLDQVLMNLAVNARDAMPGGGTVAIATSERTLAAADAQHPEAAPGRYVCLAVSDTGCGIAPDVLPRIFEPFFTTKEFGKGTGLGLATAFGIVKQHRGWIQVQTEVGRGTTFQVYLPRREEGPERKSEVPPAPGASRCEQATILLVEDDPAVRMMAEVALARAGYRVLASGTAEEALKCWERSREEIDLVLTDLRLPGGMTGQELAAQLQRERPALQVIMVSGYAAEFAGRPLELGARQLFLPKPYDVPQLLASVEAMRRS